jgi:Adenomatosis polyposis coli down-regulated 1
VTKSSIRGHWVSSDIEKRPGANGSTTYLRRDFISDEQRSTALLMLYADPEGTQRTLTIHLEGPYTIGKPSTTVPDAYEGDFHFDTAKLTAHNEFLLNLLNSASTGTCGNEPWILDVEQDVTATLGCLPLGLDLVNRNTEYDIVKVEGDKLYYGARPADGSGLDTPEKRPTALQVPMVRQG